MSKQILTLYYTRIFIILIFLFAITTSYSQETTIELPKMADQVVNKYTSVAISTNYNSDLDAVNKLKFYSFESVIKKYQFFPINTKSNWTRFTIHNNYKKDTVFYIKSPFISNLELFELKKNKLKFIGSTGINCNRKLLSVADDEARIKIKLLGNETKIYFLQSKCLFYSNYVPQITVENYLTRLENPTVNQITEQPLYVSLTYLFVGINIVFIFLAMFRFLTIKRDITYLIFALLNFIITLYNLSTYRIIIFEFDSLPQISNNEFSNYFADFMLLFYFLFFLSFLKLHKKSLIRYLLIFGCFYYCVQIFIECSDFDSVFLINFSLFFLKTTPFFNSLAYLTVFIYLAFYAKTEYYFAKYGLFSILVGTVLIALLIIQASFKINVDPIDNMFVTFLIYQISNLLDFIFFFYSLILIEKNTNTQHNELQIVLENSKKELETTKKLVENESITLKDKTQINLEKLIYIKADDHYLNVITKDDKKSHLVRGKLTEIAKELPSNFIKCHRSYIINMNYITKIQTNSIIMSDKSEIPISRAFKLETKA